MRSLLLLSFAFILQINSYAQRNEEYVELKNGQTIYGKVKYHVDDDYIKVDKVKYNYADIKSFTWGSESFLIIDTMLYKRWLEGKISVNLRQSMGRRMNSAATAVKTGMTSYSSVDQQVFLFKKGEKKLEATSQALYTMIKDNPDAVEEFNKHFKKLNEYLFNYKGYKNMIKVLEVYDPALIKYKMEGY